VKRAIPVVAALASLGGAFLFGVAFFVTFPSLVVLGYDCVPNPCVAVDPTESLWCGCE